MSLFREIDFRKGSAIEKFGAVPTATGTSYSRTEKGFALNTNINNTITYDRNLLPANECSVVIWARAKQPFNFGSVSSTGLGGGSSSIQLGFIPFYSFATGGPCIRMRSGNNYKIFIYTPDYNWHCFVYTLPGNGNSNILSSECYVDNVELTGGPNSDLGSQESRDNFRTIGMSTNTDTNAQYSRIKVYDHILTEAERNLEYKEFLESQITEKPIRGFELVKPTDLSYLKDRGLVAAYNMIPSNGTLVDISGNGNNGTITGGVVQGKEGLVFDGTTGYVNFANTKLATSDFTVITRVKLNDYPILARNIISTTSLDFGRFLGIFNKSIGLYNGSAWLSGATELISKQEYTLAYVCDSSAINLYIDGVLDGTGSKGLYNGLSLETIGKWTSDFSRNVSGVIKDIRFYNRALSLQEIKDYHNSFIKPVILEDWSGSAVSDVI